MFDRLSFADEELIAITGCGGKTSLMASLANYFDRILSARTIITTTTKIGDGQLQDWPLLVGPARSVIQNAATQIQAPATPAIVLASAQTDGKLIGYSTDDIEMIRQSKRARYIIAECDGSCGASFKAYEPYEPVVPPNATTQFVLLGADAFTSPANKKIVFRSALLHSRENFSEYETLPRNTIFRFLQSPNEFLRYAAPRARKILMVNKCDRLEKNFLRDLVCDFRPLLAAYDEIMFVSIKNSEAFAHLR